MRYLCQLTYIFGVRVVRTHQVRQLIDSLVVVDGIIFEVVFVVLLVLKLS